MLRSFIHQKAASGKRKKRNESKTLVSPIAHIAYSTIKKNITNGKHDVSSAWSITFYVDFCFDISILCWLYTLISLK